MLDSFILLSAGKPHAGSQPALLTEVSGRNLFDWQRIAIGDDSTKVQLVVGYAADEFSLFKDRAHLAFNDKWESSGSGYSLLCAELSGERILASYADILYQPELVQHLRKIEADVVLAYDSAWRQRFVGRTPNDLSRAEKLMIKDGEVLRSGQGVPAAWAHGEFIGLVLFNSAALRALRQLQSQDLAEFESLSMSDLVEWLRLQGLSIAGFDAKGDWAELNDPKDIAHFVLGTKAETLLRLGKVVKHSYVLPQVAFTVDQWREAPAQLLERIAEKFSGHALVVRSSAKSEDAFTHSNAGAYTSILNVSVQSHALNAAIEEVIASYVDCQPEDQVLVQPMLEDVWLSGVAFTRTLQQGAPFYVINYDESGDTESITSGNSKTHKALYFRKDAAVSLVDKPHLRALITALNEVETLLNYDALDIEFALDKSGQVFLLQARPITVVGQGSLVKSEHVLELQKAAAFKWQKLQVPAPHVKGALGIFGVMPDWNPAEIIGTNPGKLAVSLYEHLILNDVWAQQRAEYGYRDLRPQPLLRCFAGKPYIDVRASFNSFVPAEVSAELATKLVDFYLSWLVKHPWLHDKVEFDVLPTCFGPKFSKWEMRLQQHAGLNTAEVSQLKKGLQRITQQALTRTDRDLQQLSVLEERFSAVIASKNLPEMEKVQVLLEDCKIYGTLPFAHLARSGFVAVTLLREGVEAGWLSEEAKDGFMESLETVSHELSADARRTAQGEKCWESFVQNYGHLRPGTYEITSPAYWDDPDHYLRPLLEQADKPKIDSAGTERWLSEKNSFFTRLRAMGLDATDEHFEYFLKNAIEGREKAKFIFSKSLSAALSLLVNEGARLSLAPEQLANLCFTDIRQASHSDLPVSVIHEQLRVKSAHNEYERSVSLACQLPPLLTKLEDFSTFILTEDKPNFIGSQSIMANVVKLDGSSAPPESLAGCIVLIPQADPGYDWLFGQKIGGLITMYGGANSHMAIRSAEFGLPAAIGVGTQLYNKYLQAQALELDPAGQIIRVLR